MNILASRIVATIGLLLSAYSVYTEIKLKRDPSYNPVCEIGSNASCKAAFTSKYSKFLGTSNALIGVFAYITYLIMTFVMPQYLIYLAAFAVISSIGLAFVSYVKMHNICIICTTIYIVNILLLIFAL